MTIGDVCHFPPMPMQAIVGMLHEVRLTGRKTLVDHVAHHRMAHLLTWRANVSGTSANRVGTRNCTGRCAAYHSVSHESGFHTHLSHFITITRHNNFQAAGMIKFSKPLGHDLRATRRELNDNLRVSSNSLSLPLQKRCRRIPYNWISVNKLKSSGTRVTNSKWKHNAGPCFP